ncbi:uncharacterized protein V6R79_006788 [Siganus canaliculatus]
MLSRRSLIQLHDLQRGLISSSCRNLPFEAATFSDFQYKSHGDKPEEREVDYGNEKIDHGRADLYLTTLAHRQNTSCDTDIDLLLFLLIQNN